MAKRTANHLKLGLFVSSGILFLIVALYMIGKNEQMFGSKFLLKTRFAQAQGLVAGNNVRYAGIEVGTVKGISILNDSTIEVVMQLQTAMKKYIRQNAVASIGSDGLMGNKVINIAPGKGAAALVVEGDVIRGERPVDTDEMLSVLNRTNNDIAIVTDQLKTTIARVNNSTALWTLLNDEAIPADVRASFRQVRVVTTDVSESVKDLNVIIQNVKQGEGTLGTLLTDKSMATDLREAILKVKQIGAHADSISAVLDTLVTTIHNDLQQGEGIAHAILKDPAMVEKVNSSLANIEKGTAAFNENMNALKSSFLLRSYFNKLERQKKKTSRQTPDSVDNLSLRQ